MVPLPIHTDKAVAEAVPPTLSGSTVNSVVAVLTHPLPSATVVYIIVAEPAVNPVTMPSEVILAVPVPATVDHVPDEVASVKAGVSEPMHTNEAPSAMAATIGKSLTVNTVLVELEQPFMLTVYKTVTVPAVSPVTTPP